MDRKFAAALLLLAAALAACRDAVPERSSDTAVLGGQPAQSAAPALGDAQGRAVPAPPAPRGARVQVQRSGESSAVAAWINEGHVDAATWSAGAGWAAPQPLERIHGQSSEVQLASNGRGEAMAVWKHQVGNIHCLRYSRFDANGWSPPDVLPGALPRPAAAGAPPEQNAPRLEMDAQGRVDARWPSGFHANEDQFARFLPGEGWTRAVSAPPAPTQTASPASPAPSSAR